jgi:hypothetical protein
MKAIRLLVLAAALQCGSGTERANFRLQVSAAGATSGSDGSSRIEMRAGETLVVALLIVGAVPGPVTFTAAHLPPFATLDGPMLKIVPGRVDKGEYEMTLTATAGGNSQSTTLDVVVNRDNKPPFLALSAQPPLRTLVFNDDTGIRGATCPGPSCTAYGTPKLLISVCDEDGDAINVDVEVVPRGRGLSKIPTHSMSFSGPWDFGPCRNVSVPLPGLASEQSYDFALRISDEFGAFAGFTADGWPDSPSTGFDQGPCTARQCACAPAGTSWCASGVDCCSGVCDLAVPPSITTCQ